MMRIWVALLMLIVSIAAGLQAFSVGMPLDNYMNLAALIILPCVTFYVLWALADKVFETPPDEEQADRQASRLMVVPWWVIEE